MLATHYEYYSSFSFSPWRVTKHWVLNKLHFIVSVALTF